MFDMRQMIYFHLSYFFPYSFLLKTSYYSEIHFRRTSILSHQWMSFEIPVLLLNKDTYKKPVKHLILGTYLVATCRFRSVLLIIFITLAINIFNKQTKSLSARQWLILYSVLILLQSFRKDVCKAGDNVISVTA